jgi:hypothetical protein
MKSYGIEMMGGLVVRHYAGGMPAWGAADEGAWAWDDDGNKMYYGTDSAWVEVGSGSGGSDVGRMLNVGLAATVGSKALTVALKGEDGNDPSASNPVIIAFRDETITTGTPNVRTVTGATSVVLASGGTLGFTAALAGRIYVWAIDNAGTVELALSRTADIFPESNLVTTVAIGAGSDTATSMYSTTQRNTLACRCLGYIEITTGAVAGEWDNAPTKIQIMGPGVKRTGDVVQVLYASTASVVSCATLMVFDDTIPQITEGDEVLTQAITPTSLVNNLFIEASVFGAHSASPLYAGMALFQDATANALSATHQSFSLSRLETNFTLYHKMVAGTVSSTTFRIRCGPQTSGTFYTNAIHTSGTRMFGGVSTCHLQVTEVMA